MWTGVNRYWSVMCEEEAHRNVWCWRSNGRRAWSWARRRGSSPARAGRAGRARARRPTRTWASRAPAEGANSWERATRCAARTRRPETVARRSTQYRYTRIYNSLLALVCVHFTLGIRWEEERERERRRVGNRDDFNEVRKVVKRSYDL